MQNGNAASPLRNDRSDDAEWVEKTGEVSLGDVDGMMSDGDPGREVYLEGYNELLGESRVWAVCTAC